LLRYGPKRHRLSRADYNKAKTLKAQQAKDVDRSAALATQIAEQQGQISAMMQEADATAKQLTRQSVDLQGEKIDLLVRESETASLAARGREEIARAKAKTSSAEAMTAAITVGIKAIDDREIDYLPATREKRAGLSFGPTAPTEKTKRERLMATIMPAFDMLVGVASRVFGIRKREAALAEAEAAQVKQEPAQKDEASELRRRANVIATAIERTGKAAPGPLQNVAEGQSAAMEEASFPGAWAIAPGARPDDLSKRLNATTNLDLRAAYQATRDAVLITDEHAPLRARFDLGLRVLAANADDRGFDLETGRQDLAKAKRPEVAALHVDQFSEPIKVRVQERERQRLRGS
jgi:hypothetical protein